ncbi:MAG: hypothetical protein KDJ52_31180, partial [Anaerolineae bacterium]|nr:hypothetical protein [Anaerolineae bacterium]
GGSHLLEIHQEPLFFGVNSFCCREIFHIKLTKRRFDKLCNFSQTDYQAKIKITLNYIMFI